MRGDEDASSSFSYEELIYQWLLTALDCGISEECFWEMTIAELARAVDSFNRRKQAEAKEKASYDYILADLIGRSISRMFSSSATMPEIGEIYPTLFDTQEIQQQKQEKKAELSALRFKQFAQSFNQKFH